uniref:Uncharacterized protein n=1 Tax=Nelumbo nucifera TaxID=4432 RepID=A0A822YYG7_NELNU|nr:TPA_asm: hypothetical protein HUJ06_013467 [Nelumbo nucifera]
MHNKAINSLDLQEIGIWDISVILPHAIQIVLFLFIRDFEISRWDLAPPLLEMTSKRDEGKIHPLYAGALLKKKYK